MKKTTVYSQVSGGSITTIDISDDPTVGEVEICMDRIERDDELKPEQKARALELMREVIAVIRPV